MDSKLRSNNKRNPFINQQQDTHDVAQENIAESPPSNSNTNVFNIDGLVTSSGKKRRGIQKRVVQIPIKETEGPRLKGESNTPPSDSWAWRKYGQKPIKGSPYPRGYYRCSSSKGCPARKQVERSRVDPTMLVVTYSCEHNHPWPVSRNNHHQSGRSTRKPEPDISADPVEQEPEHEPEPEEKFAEMMVAAEDELGWLGDMASAATTSSAVLQSPIMTGYDDDVASVFLPMGEEDESLFADLEELPECSVVFRRGLLETAEQRRRYAAASWFGTTT